MATQVTVNTHSLTHGDRDERRASGVKIEVIPASEQDDDINALADPNIDPKEAAIGVFEDDSPYPEVRSAVANTDDVTIPAGTVRAWVLGLFWATSLNQFFFFRYPSVSIGGIVAQLLTYPMGKAWASLVPNVKELTTSPFLLQTDVIAVAKFYYSKTYHFGIQWMIVMSTQLIGFSVGGIARRFLVDPPSMIWPANLVTCTLFNTLHSQDYAGAGKNTKGMSRERFFALSFACSAIWYFVPGYLFQALSVFNWVCWIAPDNIVLNQMFGKQIYAQARKSLSEQPDIHARLMSRYPGVPEWWYGIIFVLMFAFAVISIEVVQTDLPVWGFVFAIVIAFIYVIPVGMIQAITNMQVGLNVITELIIGYVLPGKPIAMMLFKTWGYITMAQALTFASDFKLGHYMKIPPRQMFFAQVVCAVVAEVFGTASIIWGVIGPARQFSKGQIYYGASKLLGPLERHRVLSIFPTALVLFFPLGALLPCFAYMLAKRYPRSWVKYLNFPVILAGTGLIPPANAVNYVTWGITGFIFQYVIRRRRFEWWSKYNYVLSAALDSGVAISVIVIFFCLQYPKNGTIGLSTIQAWWGNTIFLDTADSHGTPLRTLSEGKVMFG
ncbi:hypothetical protein MD484_g457, partial [Candolleomyces efflorescens]